MGKPPSIDVFIREKGDEVVQLNLSLLTCVKLLVSADEPEKWASEKMKQRKERHGEPAMIVGMVASRYHAHIKKKCFLCQNDKC